MNGAVVSLKSRVDQLWEQYVAAKEKSQTSGDINDGIAAGRAYRQFLEEFVSHDLRPQYTATLLTLVQRSAETGAR
jgi:hypothetical protein